VLGRYAVGDDAEGKPKTRPNQAFWKPQPRAAYTGAPRPGTHAQDVVWRWSMLIGLVIVGSISLMSLIQQRAADQGSKRGRHGGRSVRSVSPACPPRGHPERDQVEARRRNRCGRRARPSTSFAQGLADRR
jgi:hypothetical protein